MNLKHYLYRNSGTIINYCVKWEESMRRITRNNIILCLCRLSRKRNKCISPKILIYVSKNLFEIKSFKTKL